MTISRRLGLAFAVALALGIAGGAAAHHSYAMFDAARTETVTGTVAKLEWTNPHVFIWVYVPNRGSANGYDLYAFENGSPNVLLRRGWSKETFAVGEKLVDRVLAVADGRTGRALRRRHACRRQRDTRRRRTGRRRGRVGAVDAPPAPAPASRERAAARARGTAVALLVRSRRHARAPRKRSRRASCRGHLRVTREPAGLERLVGLPQSPVPEEWRVPTAAVEAGRARRPRAPRSPTPIRCVTAGRGSSRARTAASPRRVEFLFTPGRVTVTNERGLIRRIYTDGQAMPADVDATNTGLSIGHWEGQTLVVETTRDQSARALRRRADQAATRRITERIFLKDPDTLRDRHRDGSARHLHAARSPNAPLHARGRRRVASEITFCTEYDRSIEPGSGKQRFDLTPPPDLPPPPPR